MEGEARQGARDAARRHGESAFDPAAPLPPGDGMVDAGSEAGDCRDFLKTPAHSRGTGISMKNSSFLDAFPIEDFRIEVRETTDVIWRGQDRSRVYTKPSPPAESVACSNPSCYGGGVSI